MTTTLRALGLALLTALPLIAAAPARANMPAPTTMPVADGIHALTVAPEARAGYERAKFKHWIDADKDGCNTRAEVLIEEAVTAPSVGPGCKITGGAWRSYYDDTTVTAASGLDIDHMVPLAEAWDSGASDWTPARREAYANDLTSPRSLVAVTAKSNRSKSDQDPAEWMPPAADAQCHYLSDWVSTKLRWRLAADPTELAALEQDAADCDDTRVTYDPAP
ncbi:HNH endonuclease family protein [Streptomyces fuscigenes]|uniref:HNH endonuclease family protein n=1 Tax=Streptomyces fuscigenes TaxID=1528880 RepID=UPI001F30D742|nr:HNH endonuclease family protein [Streptomyces fuscigenes]MCF3960451.1 HNH endonuclease family protein [Streptomyces fuscigenes]